MAHERRLPHAHSELVAPAPPSDDKKKYPPAAGEPGVGQRRPLALRHHRVSIPRGASGILDDSVFVKEQHQWQEKHVAHLAASSAAVVCTNDASAVVAITLGNDDLAVATPVSREDLTMAPIATAGGRSLADCCNVAMNSSNSSLRSHSNSSCSSSNMRSDCVHRHNEEAAATISVPSLVHHGSAQRSGNGAPTRQAEPSTDERNDQQRIVMASSAPPPLQPTAIASTTNFGGSMSAQSPLLLRHSAVATPFRYTPQCYGLRADNPTPRHEGTEDPAAGRGSRCHASALLPQLQLQQRHQHFAALLWTVGRQQAQDHECELLRLDDVIQTLQRAQQTTQRSRMVSPTATSTSEDLAGRAREGSDGCERSAHEVGVGGMHPRVTARGPAIPPPRTQQQHDPLLTVVDDSLCVRRGDIGRKSISTGCSSSPTSDLLWGCVVVVALLLLGRVWGGALLRNRLPQLAEPLIRRVAFYYR